MNMILLNHFRSVDFSIELYTIKSRRSIVYNEGFTAYTYQNIAFISLKVDFVFANSAGPDKMPHNASFNLATHCLQKYLASRL